MGWGWGRYSDSEVQPAAVTLLVDLAHTSQTHRCMEILELLKKVGHGLGVGQVLR